MNHIGERSFITTQSIKKLNKDDKKWALDRAGFKRVSDDAPVDLSEIPEDDLKVSEGRWGIEECFRIMKTDFEARPVFLQDEVRIKAHFLIYFLSLVIYRYLEKELKYSYTCETILDKLKSMNFADIQEQGFIPLYTRDKLTDALHEICGFRTDFKFITKSQMRTIQKKSKGRE